MSYIDEVQDAMSVLDGVSDADLEQAELIKDYIWRMESLLSELSSKTGFADDYEGTWHGYIEDEY